VTRAVGRRRVLIVEDEAALQSAHRRYFRDRYALASSHLMKPLDSHAPRAGSDAAR